jgi:hypothetical protein
MSHSRTFPPRCRREDWAQQASTGIARRFDVIRDEDLDIRAMTRSARGTADAPGPNVAAKAGLNRGILRSGWGPASPPDRRQGPGPGREGTTRVHEPVLLGVRARRSGEL